jgi:large subunit ribosomal protein L25
MSIETVKTEPRETTGKQAAKSMRRQGKIPAVYYFHNNTPVQIAVDSLSFQRLTAKEITVIDLVLPDGKKYKSILRDIQRDPVSDEIIHVDFMGVDLKEKVKLTIPVVLTGTPLGVKEGGILEHPLREVEVEGLPLEIPDHIEVDVSNLKVGEAMTLADLKIEKIRFVTDEKHPVAHIVSPKVTAETAEIVEETGEEPEAE